MYSYSARSIKAIAEYRYPQVNQNHQAHNVEVRPKSVRPKSVRASSDRDVIPVKRKQRSNNRAPNRAA